MLATSNKARKNQHRSTKKVKIDGYEIYARLSD